MKILFLLFNLIICSSFNRNIINEESSNKDLIINPKKSNSFKRNSFNQQKNKININDSSISNKQKDNINDSSISNQSNINNDSKTSRFPKIGDKVSGPISSSSTSEIKSNSTFNLIILISLIICSIIIILLIIYSIWIWCSPIESRRIIFEEEIKFEQMTDDELKRYKMRFGNNN